MNDRRNTRGVALIITLAMIAILTFLIVAFFSRAVTNLQVESTSTGNARADILARTAGEIIIGDFKTEIVAGSTATGSNSPVPVYRPSTSANAAPSLSRFAFTAADAPTFVNLVKQSNGPFNGRFFPDDARFNTNVKPVIQNVTNVATDVMSPNGRSVINKRWDDPTTPLAPLGPQLLISTATTAPTSSRFTSDPTDPSKNMLPRWIMMSRQGVPASQTWTNDWKNYSLDNPKAAIGRFAYNIYDTGGLLDVNAAGYPEQSPSAALPPKALGQKGSLGLAQLSVLPGIDNAMNAAAFTGSWRNLVSATTADNYLAYLGFSTNGTTGLTGTPFYALGPKTGFLQSAIGSSATDNRLLGRQDLIRLAAKFAPAKTYGLSVSSLPYLTHFARETNAPSWSPLLDAASMNGSNGTAVTGPPAYSPYAYKTNTDNNITTVPNRFFSGVQIPAGASWTRLTGEKVVSGEPLVKYRFPLSWLALLQKTDPASTSWTLTQEASDIVTAFDARRMANGSPSLAPGGSASDKAKIMVQIAFGLAWNTAENRWDYTGSPSSPTASVPTTVASQIEPLGAATSNSTVAAESREPNFFELLKAGMLSGSLGNSSDFESLTTNIGDDSNPDNQVIQIGANIIDQSDSDSYPTRIAFGTRLDAPPTMLFAKSTTGTGNVPSSSGDTKVFAGVEDIPYMYTFLSTPYRIPAGEPNLVPATDPGSALQNATRDSIDGWLQFVLWKPQQQSSSTAAPPVFRIAYTGTDVHLLYYGNETTPVEFPAGSQILYKSRTLSPVLNASRVPYVPITVTFTDSPTDFRVPTLLGGMGVNSANGFSTSQPEGGGKNPKGTVQLPRGMWLGETYRPETIYNPGSSPNHTAPRTEHTEFRCLPDARFELQYQDAGKVWRTYQQYDRFGLATGQYFRGRGLFGYADGPFDLQKENCPVLPKDTSSVSAYPAYRALDIATLALSAVDPRSQRFGLMAMYWDVPPSQKGPSLLPPTGTVSPDEWKYYLKQGWAPTSGTPYTMAFNPTNSSRFTPSWGGGPAQNPWAGRAGNLPILDATTFWADNTDTPSSSTIFYKGLDGVARRGDGDSGHTVRPMQQVDATTPNTKDLSIVLNRPFRSVGELSYVFRDEPYKTLNLFTDKSGDGALLDLFSINEQPAVVGGKVNLNTQNAAVLQAVIAGASREEVSTSNTISPADALTIAKNLVKNTADTSGLPNTGPLSNPAEIANRLATILPDLTYPDQALKTRREVVGRALAGSGQTRTWNFLVDIVAQSGRYAPGATTSAQFVVEGEKRYWLHVALDRATGQVIDKQLEPTVE